MPAFNVLSRKVNTLSRTKLRYRKKFRKVCLLSTQVVPYSHLTPAKFAINVRGYTINDDPMLCLDLKVDFMKFPFPHIW